MENIPFGIFASTVSALPITFVGANAVGTVKEGTLNLPSGLQQGDLVIVASAGDLLNTAVPTGYTVGQTGLQSSVGFTWSYKVMGATPDTQILGLTSSGASAVTHLYCIFRNAQMNSWAGSVALGTTGIGMPDSPSISVPSAGSMVIALGFLDDDRVATTVTAPTGYTLATASQSSLAGVTVMAAYKTATTSGVEDPGSFGGSGSDTWVATTVILNQL